MENKKKLYDALSTSYDMGDFDTFAEDVKDDAKRKKLYDAIKDSYDLGDFDSFSNQLLGSTKQTPNSLSDSLLNNSEVHPDSTIAQLREDTKKREEAAEKAYNESEVIYNEDKPYRPASVPQPKQAPAEGIVKAESDNLVQEQEAEERAKKKWELMNAPDEVKRLHNTMAELRNFTEGTIQNTANLDLNPAQREYKQKMDEINQAQRFGKITSKEADAKRKALEFGYRFASTPTDDMIRRTNARGVEELSKDLDEKIAERVKEVEQEWAKKYAEDSALVKGGNLRERIYAANQVQDYTPFVARESDPEYMTLVAAKRSLEDAQKLIDEADRTLNAEDYSRASQRWHSGLARGAKDQLFDVRTWDMGITEAKDMAMLSYALDKEENGEELTEAEKALLDAKAYEMAVNAYFGSYLGKGYKAGENVGAMAPFMLEMAINPLSAVGSSVQSKLVRSALKKYGKGLYQRKLKYNALKYGSRLVGDIAGAAGMTITSSLPRTYADAVSRHIGNVKPEYADYTGRAEFGGTEGGVSAGRAAYEAITAGTTERFTEMSSYFLTRPFRGMKLPKLDNKAVKAVSNFVQNANNTDLARIGGEIAKKTQWGGVVGEYFEEVENNILNAALVGDMKFDNSEEGVFNLQNNWLTLQSVAAVGGSIATIKTGYYPIYKYQQSRALKQADLQAADAFGDEWDGIKASLNGLDEQSFANLIALGKRADVTPMQKEAAKNYFQANVNLHAAQQAAIKHLSDAKTSPEEVEISQSYDIGRSLYTPEEMNEAKRELEDAKAEVRRTYQLEEDQDVDKFLGKTPLESIHKHLEEGEFNQAELKLRYLNAKAKYDGMVDAVSDKVNDEVEASNRVVDSLVNKDMGGIVNATITSAESEDGEAVTIVSGVIATDKDGNIDRDNTDSFLVYKDKDGSLKPISKDRLMSAQPMVDVEAYKEQLSNEIKEQRSNEEGAKIDGILPMNVGDTFYVMDERGLAHQAKVTGNFEDGSVAISLDNGKPQQMPREAVQAMANAFKDVEYQEKKAAQEEKERADMQQTEAQLQQEEDEKKQAQEQAQQAEQPVTATSRVPVGENGNLLYEQADSDTAWDALVEQAKGNEATAQKIADMGVKKAQKALDEVKQSTINEDMSIEEMLEAENAHNDAVAAAEANLNKWKEIASVPQRRAEEAQRVAEQETKAEAMQERIDKANEAISEEQKKAEQRMRMSNARAALQNGGRYQSENAELGAPIDFADFVMRAIATGGVRFIWGNNQRTGARGLGSHTGFGEQERRKRIGILSNSGLYPEVAAEQLLSSYADEIGYDPNIDTSDALSTILDVVMSYTTPKEMMEAAQARHTEVAAKEAEAAEIDAEEAYYRMMAAEHNMTVWEYMDMEAAYEELKNKDLEARDAVKEEIDAIFVEQYLEEDYDNERRNKDLYQGVSGQTRSGASNEGGSNVLPSAQSDNDRTAQRSAEGQGATAQVGIEGGSDLSASQTLGEPKSVEDTSSPQMRADEGVQPVGKKLSRAMNMLRIPLRKRANMWSKKVGVPAVIVEDFSEVTSQKAKANILEAARKDRRVTGWVEDGKVYLYMPNLRDIDEIDETYTHEVVGHKGMDAMLGKEEYRKFCLDVFDQVMTEADRKFYLKYEGVSDLKDETEKKAKAADEYIAHLAESTNLTKREASMWDKIVDLFRKMLESLGFPQDISKLNIEDMIRKSYNNLLEGNIGKSTEGKGTQFRVLKDEAKSLVGIHNISAEKLQKAINMGGLANPSVAVLNIDKQDHSDYGEISLILPKDMVDARLGRNAGTWAGDAWTPTYPSVIKQISDKRDVSRFYKDINKMSNEMRNKISLDFNSFLEGRDADSFYYWYLFENGNAPELQLIPAKYTIEITEKINEATNGRFSLYQLSPEQRAACVDAYIEYQYQGDRAAYERDLQDKVNRLQGFLDHKNGLVKRKAQEDYDSIKEYGFDYDQISSFLRDVEYYTNHSNQVDVNATIKRAQDYVVENNLEDDYQSWRSNLEQRYGIKEYIFDGYTNSGKKKYLPHTLENASKWMKKQGREGAVATFPSFGTFVAIAIPRMTSLSSIKKKQSLLGNTEQDFEEFKSVWEDVYYSLGQKLQPNAQGFDDYGWWRLIEAAGTKNPQEHIKRQYGIELSKEDTTTLNNMLDAIRNNYPARYFETKFERPVNLSEFVAAVVPNDIPADLEENLQKSFLNIYKYDPKQEGSRRAATLDATNSDNIRFRVADDIAAEQEQIVAEAKANGTYLKAPNGKDTNLTPEQWAMVRTKAFKKWFGDWDSYFKKNFLLKGSPVATLNGDEFSKVEGKTLTDQVSEYFEQIGGKAISPLYGDVVLDRKGADDSLTHGMGRNKAIAYAAVKEVIENGVLIDAHTNHKGRGYNTVVVAAPIEIKGERYACVVVIRRNLNENKFYLHEVTAQKNLLNDAFVTNSAQKPASIGDIANILQNIVSASDETSKIVDANGEPKVVWHGGQFAMSNFVPLKNMHFGTKRAALERILDQELGYDDVEITKAEDGNFGWKYTNPYEEDDDAQSSQSFATEIEAYEDAVNTLTKDVVVKPYFLNIKSVVPMDDAGSDWNNTIEEAKDGGYDGIVYENWYEDKGSDSYIAFEPNQIKSATENVGTFDAGKNDIRFRTAPAFYSNAERAVENIKQEKATPEQWLKMIEKNGGLKAGEDKWLGLSDWLKASDKKTLTKQEVLDYIKANEIQIEEVVYGSLEDTPRFKELRNEYKSLLVENDYNNERTFEAMVDKYGDDFDLAFEGWGNDLHINSYYGTESAETFLDARDINDTRIQYTTDGLDNKREIALVVPTIESWNESDEIHFGDAGNGRAIAWVRFGETTDAEGNRVLVIDEVQSKRHQEGREKGYNNPRIIEILNRLGAIESYMYSPQGMSGKMYSEREALKAELESLFEADNPVMKATAEQLDEKTSKRAALLKEKSEREDDERVEIIKLQNKQDEVRNVRDYDYYESEINEIQERIDQRNEELDLLASDITALNNEYSRYYNTELRNARIGVSPAPFEKNWAELAMKRMLRYAAENGFDKVAWTTGEQQADRYDMGGVIDAVKVTKYPRGIEVVSLGKEGNIVHSDVFANESAIADVYGKEMAVKIVQSAESAQPAETTTLSGDNLHIGGSGMKAFYDQMIPSFMNKYGKKWGVKVGEVTMPNLEENNTMHSVDVTDAMRESVMQGQPMFRVTSDKARFDEVQEEYDALDKNDEAALNAWRDKKVGVVRDYLEGVAQRFGLKPEIVVFNGADESQMKEAYVRLVESYRKSGTTPPSYEAFKEHSLKPKVFATYRKDGDIITFNISTRDLYNEKDRYAATLFHEDAHHFAHILYSEKELQEIWATVKNSDYSDVDVINTHENYKDASDAKKGNEFIARSVGAIVRDYKDVFMQFVRGNIPAEDVVAKLEYKQRKANFAISEILNLIKDEYQETKQRDRDNLLGGVRDGGDNRVSRQTIGERSNSEGRRSLLDSVSQKGLRGVVSEDALISFFKGVYNRVDNTTRNEIYEYVKRNGDDFWKGTEQYLASLAESNAPLDGGVRDAFVQMLNNNGIEAEGLTDNDIRYMMWRTNQLKDNNGALSVAEDVVMKQKLGVDNAQPAADTSFRVVSNGRSIRDKYDKRVNTGKGKLKATAYNFQEAMQDEMLSLKIYQQLLEEVYGVNIPSYLNVYNAENSLSSRNKVEMDRFVETLYEDMMQEIDKLIKAGATEQEVRDYVVAKSGIERSIEFTVRDYINEQAERKQLTDKEAKEQLAEIDEKVRNSEITPAEADAMRYSVNRQRNTNLYDKDIIEGMRKLYEEKRDALRDRLNGGKISFDKWVDESLALAQSYTRKKVTDAAGLTDMAKRMGLEDKDWLSNARKVVNEFEEEYNYKRNKKGKQITKDATNTLWNAINACNNATLNKLYDTGVISKDLYDKLQKQFMFYVPMSGFTEDVAEDVYSYIGNETGAFTPPIKKAGGRLSESDDPFAIIGNKMQSAILQGNRNAMKIKFLNLHRQFPTDLITEGRFWEVKQPDGSWQVEYPEIPSKDASAEEVKATVDEFNERMKRLKESGDARIYRGKANVPYKITHKSHENQHQITVRLMGEPITMFVNGNPQLAKAINGKLGKVPSYRDFGKVLGEYWQKAKRISSATKTSWNPNFIAPNVLRDFETGVGNVFLEYGIKDAGRLIVHFFPALGESFMQTIGFGSKGKIGQHFEEFIRNGGETGYSHIDNIDAWKKKARKRWDRISKLRAIPRSGGLAFEGLRNFISAVNGIFEDATRFAAYRMHRTKGESIVDSIKAAKDISTNFNKKGADGTEGIWGFIASFLRGWKFLFFNPMVQGAYRFGSLAKQNKGKASVLVALPILAGFFNAMWQELRTDDEDDEKKYLNQNPFTRRTHLMIFTGEGYVKIPLTQILRELYAVGDIAYCLWRDNISKSQAALAIFNTLRSIVNLEGQSSLTGEIGDDYNPIRAFLTQVADPVTDVVFNEDFTGSPIYRDASWDQDKPQYQRVYQGTWQWLINISRKMEEFLVDMEGSRSEALKNYDEGVSSKRSSKWMNAGVWQHLLESIGGGLLTTITDGITSLIDWRDEDERVDRNRIPIARRFYSEPSERTAASSLLRDYYNITNIEQIREKQRYENFKAATEGKADKILEQLQAEENAYLDRVEATKNDAFGRAELEADYHSKEKNEERKNRLAEAERLRQQFKAYQESPDGQFYLKTEEIIKAVDKLRREIKKVEDDDLKKQKKAEMETKQRELVELWKADERN